MALAIFLLIVAAICGAIYIFINEIVARTATDKGSSIAELAKWGAIISYAGAVLEWVF